MSMLKILILLLIVVALYALISYARIAYTVKKAANPNIKHTELTIGSGPALRYIATGDSTAVGEGATDSGHTYPDQIATNLSERFTVTYKNIGGQGAQTTDVIKNQLQTIIDFQPDIVTLSIGANDQTHLKSKQQILNNFKKIIERLTTDTKAIIYIANIPDFSNTGLLPAWYRKLIEHRSQPINTALQTLKNDRVKIVPIHELGTVALSGDLFHPNNEGYTRWAETFLNVISK